MGYDAPFEGLIVVDLSQGVAGPYWIPPCRR